MRSPDLNLHGYTNRKLSVVSGPRFEPPLGHLAGTRDERPRVDYVPICLRIPALFCAKLRIGEDEAVLTAFDFFGETGAAGKD